MIAIDYKCEFCDEVFELKADSSDYDPKICPECGGKAERCLSAGNFSMNLTFQKGRFSQLKDHLAMQKEERKKARDRAGEIRKKGKVNDI